MTGMPSFGAIDVPDQEISDQLDVSFRCGRARSQFGAVSKKVPFPCCVSVASIGHNRANAISENEPGSEPECERDCEVRHHITLTPDREIGFRRWRAGTY